jgi:DUF4097 and DUF4098 domain-containing protein YvlB
MFRRALTSLSIFLLCLALAPTANVEAQQVIPNDEWCDDDSGDSRSERYCEVREFSFDARDLVRVDAEPNGGIRVEAWDRNEISLKAKVQGWSRRGNPQEIVNDIQVSTGNTISADGPRTQDREGWSVSFRLMVPRNSNLDLESVNGGIQITGVYGDMDFRTQNGGIRLEDIGGKVEGRTQNGGVKVLLSGNQWEGDEMDVQTTNGGVTLTVPENFRANLQTGTVNGSFNTDFPITLQGRLRSNQISTELNGGGPSIRLVTTNGSVRLKSN